MAEIDDWQTPATGGPQGSMPTAAGAAQPVFAAPAEVDDWVDDWTPEAASGSMTDYPVEFGKGFVEGAKNLPASALKGIGAAQTVRAQDTAMFADAIERAQQGVDPATAIDQVRANPPAMGRIADQPLYQAGKAIEEFGKETLAPRPGFEPGKSWTRDIGSGFGSMAAGIATSMVPFGGPALAGAMFLGSGMGEAVDRAIEHGATEEQALQAAQLGAVAGATDIVDALLPALGSTGKALGFIKRVGLRTVYGALAEGGQEAVQSIIQNAIAKGIYKPEQEYGEGVTRAALIGAIVGGVTSGGVSAAQGRGQQEARARTGAPTATDAVETPRAQQAMDELDAILSGPDDWTAPAPAAAAPEPVPASPTTQADPLQDLDDILAETRPAQVSPEEAMLREQEGMSTFAPSEVVEKIDTAAAETNPEPTAAQKEAGNYKKGHVSLHGLEFTIETPRGAERTGVDFSGKPWTVTLPDHYGYIKKTEGSDGDQVDAYIGPNPESERVFVVDQKDAETGKFDEHKVMVGYETPGQALDTYEAAFSDGRAPDRIRGVTELSVPEFKNWLAEGDTTKPLSSVPRSELTGAVDLKKEASKTGAMLPKTELFLQYGNKRYVVGDFREASEKVTAARDEGMRQGLGGSDFKSPLIVDSNGKVVGYVSWNGRVWPGRPEDWASGVKPIFDNRDSSSEARETGPSDSGMRPKRGGGMEISVDRTDKPEWQTVEEAPEKPSTPSTEPAETADIKSEERADGLQVPVSAGDAQPGAQDVQPIEQGRPAGGTRGAEVERGPSDVSGTDSERAEGRKRLPAGAVRTGGRGAGESGSDRVPEGQRPTDDRGSDQRDPAPAASVEGENYLIEPGALDEARSWKTKAQDNVRAIELVRKIEAEGRPATREEQAQLARYVGWGGIKGVFLDADGKFGKGYEAIGAKVKDLLSPTEYSTARRSIQYAHYTAEDVVRSMWSAAERLGFTGGKVFEPGMGVGNFAGMMSGDLAAKTQYVGLELDHTTARIARLLYPKWGVRRDDFTKAPLPENTFDLVIGNPPFADVAIKSDPKYAKQAFLLHDYFFAKSLDAVRPGGLLMFISSAGTMNKKDPSAREYLADRADFVGAIRLPSNAFAKNAGTEVTTDIIMLRKRLPDETPGDRTWTETVEQTLPSKDGGKITGLVNRYFAEHPDMVLGEPGFFDKLYLNRYAVHARPGFDLKAELAKAVDTLPSGIMSDLQTPTQAAEHDFGSKEKKEGTFYVGPDGNLLQMQAGAGVPVGRRGKGVEGGKTAQEVERIRGLIPVRDALRAVYDADLNSDKENGDRARARLNKEYDAFVKKFGPINKAEIQKRRPNSIQQESARNEAREEARYAGADFDEGTFDPSKMIEAGATLSQIAKARQQAREDAKARGRNFDEGAFDPDEMPDVTIDKRPNVDPFMDDPESYRLRAIEKYDDNTNKASKGAVFTENLITKDRPPTINSVNDAVLYVLNQKGRLDIDAIAALVDKSPSETIQALGDRIYKEPGTRDVWITKDQYLSGNVRKKLLLAKEAAETNPEFQRNVDALEGAQPIPLAPSQIKAKMGMPWIPPETVEEFGRDALGLEEIKVLYVPALAQWMARGDGDSTAATTTWGTSRRSAPQLMNDVLNRQQTKIYDPVRDAEGRPRQELNVTATEKAQEKAAAIQAKFDEWIYADPERSERLAALYNEKYNNLVVREFDGSYLTTPGISKHWSWRPHQTRVVARIIQNGNTYMAHAVGAGKTSAMIGAGMEMKRLGLVRKPMYSVPNHMLGQFTKEFYEQYPTARIAIADERRFHTARRKQFIANVAVEDLDAVIIPHPAMGMIPVSEAFQDGIVQQHIEQYREVLSQIPSVQDTRITRSRIEKQIERLEQRLSGKNNKRRDQVFTFEEMGVDFLFVDEAHLFRKLDFTTQMANLKGVTPEGSGAAWDLYVKTLYLDSQNPGRSLVMASGTPVTNTMAELFTLSRFMQRQELEERGLAQFDAWAGAFGESVTELEQDAAGGYKPVSRFAKFVNVAELSAMVRQAMDVVTSRQLEQYVTRPKLKGGERIMNLAEKTPALERFQANLARRMEAIAKRKGPPKKGDDIMLSVINDGRHAAIDMRLAGGSQADGKSKLDLMIDNVFRIWKETKRQKFYHPKKDGGGYESTPADVGPATQMIFANLGLSGARGFSVPDYIRSELHRRGVPKDQIAYIYNYKSHVARQKLFNDMNEGKVRILIGSTAKMATGVNAQRRLYAIHNQDPLWYPADDEQRNGRGIRQGNMNPEIEINDYSTKGTYDSTMWGLMEKKARFIQGFFEGDPSMRDMEDLGEAGQYAQAKAITTNDPRLIRLTELKQDLERARRRKDGFEQELYALLTRRRREESDRGYWTKRLAQIKADIKARKDVSGDDFTATAGGKTFSKRVEFGEAIMARLDAMAKDPVWESKTKIGEIGGFPLIGTPKKAYDKSVYVDVRMQRSASYESDISSTESALGFVRSAEAKLAGFEREATDAEARIKASDKFLAESADSATRKFQGDAEIAELRKAVSEVEADLARVVTPVDQAMDEELQRVSSLDELQRLGTVDLSTRPRSAMRFPFEPLEEVASLGAGEERFDARRDLTPRAQEKRPLLEKQLTAVVRGIAGPHVRVAFQDKIPLPDSSLKAWGSYTKGVYTAAGTYIPAERLIKIALADPKYRHVASTTLHESFHAVENLLLNDREMAVLKKAEPQLRNIAQGFAELSTEQAAELVPFEVRAIAFEAFADARANKQPVTSFPAATRAIFDRMRIFFERIRNALSGLGFKSAEDVFTDVFRGRMAGRSPSARPFTDAADVKGGAGLVNTNAFRRWFGDSKVVDAEGKPLRVYHGTAGLFDAFDHTKASTSSMHATAYLGHFFSASPEVASGFVPQRWDLTTWPHKVENREGGNVMPVFLKIETPYEMPLSEFRKMVPRGRSKEGLTEVDDLRDRLIAEGYDGIHIVGDRSLVGTMAGDEWSADTYIAFRPEQIKSATGNRGTFDPNNPSILFDIKGGAALDPVALSRFIRGEVAADELAPGQPKWAKVQAYLEANFTAEQREKMGSVLDQVMVGAPDMLETLAPRELATVEKLMGAAGGMPPAPPAPPSGAPGGPGDGARRRILDRIVPSNKNSKRMPTFNQAYTVAKDDLNPLRVLRNELTDGRDIPIEADPYRLARLTRGSFGKAQQMLETGTFAFNGLADTGKGLKPILEPVKNDMDGFRAYMAARRTLELAGRGIRTGIQIGDAATVARQGHAKFGRPFTELVAFQRRVLDYLRDSGVVSPEAYAAMVEANKDYVPFFRLMEGDAEGSSASGRNLKVRDPIRGIKGSDREIIDPIESIIKNTYLYIALAEKNRALTALDDLAQESPKGEEFLRTPKKGMHPITVTEDEVARFLASNGIEAEASAFTIFRPNAFRPAPDEISFFRSGKREVRQVDPDVAKSVKAMDRESFGLVLKILEAPARMLRAGATLSPDFIVRNPVRDQFSAMVFSEHGYIPVYDMARGLGGILRNDAAYQSWLKAGGANSAMVSVDRNYIENNVMQLAQDPTFGDRVKNVVMKPIDFLRMVSELAENATRLGEFKRGIAKGKSPMEAAFSAREITLDFARIGAQMRGANAIVPFFNAQVEGTDREIRGFVKHPFRATFLAAAAITLPSVLLWMANHDDPRYPEIPQWQKDLFWLVFTDKWDAISEEDAKQVPAAYKRLRGNQWEQNNGTIWRIPKPFALGILFGSVPERVLDAYYGDHPNAFKHLGKSIKEAFLPNVFPTIIAPFIEQFSNRSLFTERPIVPKYLEDVLPEYQYAPYTSETAKLLGKALGAMGVDKSAAGSPLVIDNYIRAWTGGLGQYVVAASDKALTATGIVPSKVNPTMTPADMPIIRAFAVRHPSGGAQSIQDFYETYEERRKALGTVRYLTKLGEPDSAGAVSEERNLETAERVHKALGQQMKFARDVAFNRTMTPADKRRLIDTTYLQAIDLAKTGNDIFRATAQAKKDMKGQARRLENAP